MSIVESNIETDALYAAESAALEVYLRMQSVKRAGYCDPVQEAQRMARAARVTVKNEKMFPGYDPIMDDWDKDAHNAAVGAYYKVLRSGVKTS